MHSAVYFKINDQSFLSSKHNERSYLMCDRMVQKIPLLSAGFIDIDILWNAV